MNKKRKKGYSVIKKHYIILLILCGLIVAGGIIMTLLNQSAYGLNRSKSYTKWIEITGPQTIVLGTVLLLLVCYYIRVLYKENSERNKK